MLNLGIAVYELDQLISQAITKTTMQNLIYLKKKIKKIASAKRLVPPNLNKHVEGWKINITERKADRGE